ncbi:MAG: fructose-bisphosphate aldolase class I [Gammaproteobacteria bacterium]|nr:MAG: fructose-bisphosphate aldolase class I [Gammaproteobacteria bacterium]
MNVQELNIIASAMVAPGRGILAMDESHPTCNKRFEGLGITTTEEMRQAYRDMLVTAPGLSDYIGGAILFDETIRQKTLEGTPFAEYLRKNGIIPGIKVDAGAKVLAGHEDEKVTEGLDGLRERLAEYYKLGARFSKWRAVITIGKDIPSWACIEANAHALARYALLSQEAGIVPIVEPEVLMDGDHSIEQCYEVTELAQRITFQQIKNQGVALEGMILKPSMVISGASAANRADVQTVAEQTIKCLLASVPASVPGIAFLSGGQSDEEASAHLNAMNAMGVKLPWALTFSYGRALQQTAMKTWMGESANVEKAQNALLWRAKCNGSAALGKYTEAMEKQAA